MSETSLHTENIALLTEYLRAGELPICDHRLGFELEHIIVDATTFHAVPYEGEHGVRQTLEELSSLYEERTGEENLIGLSRHEGEGDAKTVLTLEPGAQIEISTGPFSRVEEIGRAYTRFRSELDGILLRKGQIALAIGYQPRDRATDIPLIPKKRYEFMDRHFKTTGECGACMMRSSASTQISIDYCDEEEAVYKLRLATALGPLFSLLTDNTVSCDQYREGARMRRTSIWDSVDPVRCGTIPHLFEKGYGFKDYARYAMETPLIVAADNGNEEYVGQKTATQIYGDHLLSVAEIQHILSMFFFDVRLKNYIEIRMADSMPEPYALAYAALVKGIFSSEENLKGYGWLVDRICANSADEIDEVKQALIKDGYEATVYGRGAQELIVNMIESAQKALDGSEAAYLEPLTALADNKTTLAQLKAAELADFCKERAAHHGA